MESDHRGARHPVVVSDGQVKMPQPIRVQDDACAHLPLARGREKGQVEAGHQCGKKDGLHRELPCLWGHPPTPTPSSGRKLPPGSLPLESKQRICQTIQDKELGRFRGWLGEVTPLKPELSVHPGGHFFPAEAGTEEVGVDVRRRPSGS